MLGVVCFASGRGFFLQNSCNFMPSYVSYVVMIAMKVAAFKGSFEGVFIIFCLIYGRGLGFFFPGSRLPSLTGPLPFFFFQVAMGTSVAVQTHRWHIPCTSIQKSSPSGNNSSISCLRISATPLLSLVRKSASLTSKQTPLPQTLSLSSNVVAGKRFTTSWKLIILTNV